MSRNVRTASGRGSNAWEAIGKTVAVVTALIIVALLRGLVLKIMWGWFIVPLGVTPINIPMAIGIAMTVGMLTQRESDPNDKRSGTEKFVTAFFTGIFGAGFVLFFGWIVQLFI